MARQLYMVGLIASDMPKSVAFYRQLGVALPESSDRLPHAEVRMDAGLTFFVNVRGRVPELDDAGVLLEFYLQSRPEVDAKYDELSRLGSPSRDPFVASIGMYFALVKDPDSTSVLLSAD